MADYLTPPRLPAGVYTVGEFTYRESESPPMARKDRDEVRLVEFDRHQVVVDTRIGRIVIGPDSVRFHKNGRGRGLTVVGE